MVPFIHIFGIHVPLYAVMTVLGVALYFILYFVYVEKVEKIDRQTSNRMLFVSFIGLGALALFAYLLNSLYHSIEQGKVVWGGITWLGGLIGLFPAFIFGMHFLVPKSRGRVEQYISLIVPGLVLGHALGRIGCFLGGCCYGKVTNGPFGVVFPIGSLAAVQYPAEDGRSLPVYPTQLFEAVFEFALFVVLVALRKKSKSYAMAIYIIAYSVFRFCCEFLRGDDRGAFAGVLSPSQWSCILFLIFGILLVLYQKGITFSKLKEKRTIWQQKADVWAPSATGKEAQKLEDLHVLYQKGVLSKEEYEGKKKEVLKRM